METEVKKSYEELEQEMQVIKTKNASLERIANTWKEKFEFVDRKLDNVITQLVEK